MSTARASRKRMCLFTSSLGGGGVQRSMRQLAVGLVKRGYHVDLVVCHGDEPLADQLARDGVTVFVLQPSPPGVGRPLACRADPGAFTLLGPTVVWPIKTWRKLAYLAALRDHLVKRPPDALLSAMTQCNLVALWAHRLAGRPGRIAVSERNMLSAFIQRHAKKSRWRHLAPLVGHTYQRADAVIAVSRAVADDLILTSGLAHSAVDVAPNPVVDDTLRQDVARARAEPRPPGGPQQVLGVGRLVDQKDPMTLLRAFARVRRERAARLTLVGDGELRTALVAEAQRLGVASDVSLPGWDERPFHAMAQADVFVLPSRWEGLPGVLIQALAAGCAVVATDAPGGSAEILDHGRYGHLVPVGDVEAMARAIIAALDTPDDAAVRIERAEDFSVDRACAAYAALLDPEQSGA
ncbi:glycosyltransferase [uncultured Salinisphaera sp.]|uniref:glycosyltransferase n=1 Tax=uncultured Salinisphaera sp. TaxID=359372 RepID=UPI0032B1234D